jgi:D-alanine-D-alanine ligase
MNLLTPKFTILDDGLDTSNLRFPLAIKPTNQGSSIGIHKVDSIDRLERAYTNAKQYGVVMAEEWIEGVELSVPIIGTEALPSIRIEAASDFYDYDSKYIHDSSYYCPSEIGEQNEKKIRDLAYLAFNSLGCKGWARVDFLMDSNYNFYLLEVNTVPGMTEKSLVPKSAKVKGWDYPKLILNILKSSYND